MKNHNRARTAFWSTSPVKATGLLLGFLFTSCIPPPALDLQHPPDFCVSFLPVAAMGTGTASGDATIRNKNEVHNGNFDVQKDQKGLISADLYGPLGISVASLHADPQQGTIMFENREYTCGINQTMDTLPLEWGKGLTFGEFLQIILGRIPAAASETLCKKEPDSIVKKRNTIYALWKTDSLELRVEINARSRRVTAVNLYFRKKEPGWRLLLGSFHKGIAHKIQFREDDGNYFLIHYTKVNFHPAKPDYSKTN